jgi:hypothetical protein
MVLHTQMQTARISVGERQIHPFESIHPESLKAAKVCWFPWKGKKKRPYGILQNLSFQIRIELELPDMYTHIEKSQEKRFAKSFRC